MARPPGLLIDEASTGSSRVVAARALAHLAQRGFVDGLRGRDLPRQRHPSYAALISYRFGIHTLWFHEHLQASLGSMNRSARISSAPGETLDLS